MTSEQPDPIDPLRAMFQPGHPLDPRKYRQRETIGARARAAAEQAHRLTESAANLEQSQHPETSDTAWDEHLDALRQMTGNLTALAEQAERLDDEITDLHRVFTNLERDST